MRSGTCTYTTNNLNQYTAAGTTSYQYDDSGNMVHDEDYAYGYDPENRLVLVRQSGPYGTLTLESGDIIRGHMNPMNPGTSY
jgi:YD repeat-containing protein